MVPAENIRLIVCDIDNTIIPPGEPAMSRRLAFDLHQAMAKGIRVLINTGRHYTFLQPSLFEDLPMERIGTINGACVTDREGHTIAKHPISEAQMNAITEQCLANNVGLGFKFEDHIVTYANHRKFMEGYLEENSPFADRIIDDTAMRTHHLTYGMPLGTFLIGREEITEEFRRSLPELQFAWSYRGGYDVFLKSVDKSMTVETVLQETGLSWDNVIAFGDAGNDTPFIAKAGIGVVMGNGHDDVKEHADLIADECRNDGAAKMLEELKIV